MSVSELFERAIHFSNLIDAGIAAMREQAVAYAQAEADYRKGRSEAWVRCPNDDPTVKAGEREWTAARREAWVDAQCADLRYARDLAEAMRQSALEAVRSRRAQLSAIQSMAAVERAEAELARVGPT